MTTMNESGRPHRSTAWFGGKDKDGFIHRSWMRNQGLPPHLFDGRPVIGICNTFSELTPCNAHFRELAERVKRGVYEAGGLPLEFPVFSLGETNLRPTAMLFRNLASMDVEESIRGNPIDGVVLLCGCDKTTPALLMGAASCDLPTAVVSGGPMLNGKFRGGDIGSGTHVWKIDAEVRAGKMSIAEFMDAEACMSRSVGHCMSMGTASTMACVVESLGMALPGNAAIPAVDARRNVLAHMTGRRIVEMVREDLRMSKVVTRDSLANAVRAVAAIGGSTNAVLHVLALAGRLEIPFTLNDWDEIGANLPTLVDLMPAGRFLMEDFYYAGGLPPVLRVLDEHGLLDGDARTISGTTLRQQNAGAEIFDDRVIRPFDQPLHENGGIAVLRGNLAPRGAVIKPAAATAELMQHRGRAVVFDSIEQYRERIADPALAVEPSSVLVLRGCGPKGYPGMPELGNFGLPQKLLEQGVRDMVRISDARMSGTAYGTAVLHVAPESADGGTLALVRDGDEIELDVAGRRLQLFVDDRELARRRALWQPPPPRMASGYQRLYHDHVQQADSGC
ncbi:MAG: dihydroxy-acid dehydratase, partial [Planctomycetes bacterium]|nr:dihydroxy-acid dehydratase [Planctomycetota bacterium]